MARGKVLNYRYITNRSVNNKAGEPTGNIRARVRADSDTLEGFYKCPECGHNGKISQAFRRPINVKCENCSFLMRLPKLKDEIKKEKKAGR
jgi:predicted  nucleic acid-binding Zn ribbon protein